VDMCLLILDMLISSYCCDTVHVCINIRLFERSKAAAGIFNSDMFYM